MALVEKNHWKVYDKPIDIYSVYQPIQDFAHDALRKDMKLIFTTHPLLVEQTIEEKEEVLADLSSKDGEFGYVYYSNPFHNKEDALYRQKLSKQLVRCMQVKWLGELLVRAFPILTGLCMIKMYL